MFNNGKTNLKFSKKRNQWENSTQSCTITVNENEKDFYKAYSYREVIFYYEETLKKWIFNDYKFSPTTTNHQYELSCQLRKIASVKNIIYGDFKTLNKGFKYDYLDVSEENLKLVEEYFPENLESFKEKLAEKNQDIKDARNKQAKIKKIEKIDYSTKKAMIKAMESIDYGKAYYKYSVDPMKSLKLFKIGFNKSEIENYFSFPRKINVKDLFYIEKNFKEFLENFENLESDLEIYRYIKLETDFLNYLKEKNLMEKFIEINQFDLTEKSEKRYTSEAEKSLKDYLILQGLKDLV